MCFFIGYKYEGGGYRVWDPKRRVVVESKDIVFFEDGLPPPTLNEARLQQNDADEPVAQPAPDHILEPPTPPDVPPTPQPTTTPHIAEATPDPAPDLTTTSDPTPQPRIVVRLPGRWMNRPEWVHRPSECARREHRVVGDADAIIPVLRRYSHQG